MITGAVRNDHLPPHIPDTTTADGEFDEGSRYIDSLRADIDGPTGEAQAIAPSIRTANSAVIQPSVAVGRGQSQSDAADVVDASLLHDRPEIASGSGQTDNAITNATDEPQATAHDEAAATHTISLQSEARTTAHLTNGDTTHIPELQQDSRPDHAVVRLIQRADRSAGKLVNLLAHHFPSFRDECRFEGRKVRLLKRAQIFVADLWAALNGTGLGEFDDVGHLTMFAGVSLHSAIPRGYAQLEDVGTWYGG